MSSKNSKMSLWLSTSISVVVLLLIVVVSYVFEKTITPNLNKSLLTSVSVIIALIPPLLWLSVFYRQDRKNPEPKGLVFKTLILGALIQKAVYVPIVSLIFPTGNAGFDSIGKNMVATIIIVAVVQEAIKMLAVRYSIYPCKEFDEDIDGIIYGSALGLGFAAMSSIASIISMGGAMLTNATVLVVIETFSHASITGLSCYFLGVSKHAKYKILRLPAALILASSLNAIIQFLLNTVVRQGFKVNYLIGLLPAAIVAITIFGVLVFISSRHEKEGGIKPQEPLEQRKAAIGIIPVWIILALVLVMGIVSSNVSLNNQVTRVDGFIEIEYPLKWIKSENDTCLFKASDMLKDNGLNSISVKKFPIVDLINIDIESEEEKLQNCAAAWSIRSGRSYRFYQSESGYYLDTKGKETYIINYYYVSNNQTSLGDTNKPNVGYGRDIITIADDNLYIITISSSYESFILNNNKFSNVNYNFIID